MGNVIQLARNPEYCCDWWEWSGSIHFRCIHLYLEGFDMKCREGIPMDEDQFPPIMECFKYKESEVGCSIYSEVIIKFPEQEKE